MRWLLITWSHAAAGNEWRSHALSAARCVRCAKGGVRRIGHLLAVLWMGISSAAATLMGIAATAAVKAHAVHLAVGRWRRFASEVRILHIRGDIRRHAAASLLHSQSPVVFTRCGGLHTLASSPPKLPKLRPFPWPCKLEGGRPPLVGGWGIGEGEVWGEVMRGLEGVESEGAWVAAAGPGEVFALAFIEPN